MRQVFVRMYTTGKFMLSRNLYHDSLGIGSKGQIKQDLLKQNHQICQLVQLVQVSCHLHLPLCLWDMDPACQLRKGPKRSRPSAWGNFSVSPTWSSRPKTGVQSKIKFFVGPQEPFLATIKTWKFTWLGQVYLCAWQPLQNHPSGHLEVWATPWSAAKNKGWLPEPSITDKNKNSNTTYTYIQNMTAFIWRKLC